MKCHVESIEESGEVGYVIVKLRLTRRPDLMPKLLEEVKKNLGKTATIFFE